MSNALQKSSSTDSLFGMALAQAFAGAVFGAAVDTTIDCAEAASEIYSDRFEAQQQRTNGKQFEMGVKKSLAPTFADFSSGHTSNKNNGLQMRYLNQAAAQMHRKHAPRLAA